MNRKKIRVLVVDDHALVRYGVRRLLQEEPDIEFVGEAASIARAQQLVRTEAWDIVIMDLKMPGNNALDGVLMVKREKPNLPVLIVTVFREEEYAMRALKCGVSGYLSKDSAPDHLVVAIRKILAGGLYLSDNVTRKLAVQARSIPKETPHELFSDRELSVLCAISEGKPLSQIAKNSNLSPKTITTYRKRVLGKLGLRSNTELVRYALTHELIHCGGCSRCHR